MSHLNNRVTCFKLIRKKKDKNDLIRWESEQRVEFKCKKSKLDIQLCRKSKKTYVYPVAVVYEGCPKAFDAGIWWPKTRFGRPAATQCPKGSVGEYLSDLITIKSYY